MSYKNPTPLRLGMTGIIAGTRYQVVGRVVLGEQEQGSVYYWNEFNLESEAGEVATLVYEETERGDEWRLFQLFEPTPALTAPEAAAKRLGDFIELDGTRRFIRFVSTSRVYYLEGKAPEGVDVGDLAHYFNAPAGNTMLVVSWTGAEVECYRGVDLSLLTVASAFHLRLADFRRLFRPGRGARAAAAVLGLAGLLVLAVLLLTLRGGSYSSRRPPPVVRTAAPPSRVVLGKTGTLGRTHFQVQSHLLVEMAEVGQRFDRHEYVLADDQGGRALLVRGSRAGAGDWWLFRPLQPLSPLTPQQAGAIRWGQSVEVDAIAAKVSDLFQATVRQMESAESAELAPGDVFFGFAGPAARERLLVRWNASYINFFQGQAFPEKEVLAAFGR